MSIQKSISREGESSRSARPESASEEVADRLAGLLPADALQDALAGLRPEEITGPGGLVTQLAGRVLETALGAELTEHLGYPPGQAPPGGAGNTRNGSTSKRVHTELGTVQIKTPRIAMPALSRSWSASARPGWRAWMSGCSGSTPAA